MLKCVLLLCTQESPIESKEITHGWQCRCRETALGLVCIGEHIASFHVCIFTYPYLQLYEIFYSHALRLSLHRPRAGAAGAQRPSPDVGQLSGMVVLLSCVFRHCSWRLDLLVCRICSGAVFLRALKEMRKAASDVIMFNDAIYDGFFI